MCYAISSWLRCSHHLHEINKAVSHAAIVTEVGSAALWFIGTCIPLYCEKEYISRQSGHHFTGMQQPSLRCISCACQLNFCMDWSISKPCSVCIAGIFEDAAQSYIRALELKAESPAVWDSLSMAFVAMGQFPLADLADKHDLRALTGQTVGT